MNIERIVRDDDELAILACYREVRDHGFGRFEVIVVDHKMRPINQTKILKAEEILGILDPHSVLVRYLTS